MFYRKVGKKVKKGKKIAQWNLNKDTHVFLSALASKIGIPKQDLLESSKGGYGGTWIHPQAAIHLAMWISPAFAVHVIRWTARFLTGDLGLVRELIGIKNRIHRTITMVTITSTHDSSSPDILSHTHMVGSRYQTEEYQRSPTEKKLCLFSNVQAPNIHTLTIHSEWIQEHTSELDTLWNLSRIEDLYENDELFKIQTIYFIREAHYSTVKVGFTRHLAQRMARLQCGNSNQLKVVFEYGSSNCRDDESRIHSYLTALKWHIRGEWFTIPIDTDYLSVVRDALHRTIVVLETS